MRSQIFWRVLGDPNRASRSGQTGEILSWCEEHDGGVQSWRKRRKRGRDILLPLLGSTDVSSQTNNPPLIWISACFVPRSLSFFPLVCHFASFIPPPFCPIPSSLDLIWASTFALAFYLSNYVATHLWMDYKKPNGMLGGGVFLSGSLWSCPLDSHTQASHLFSLSGRIFFPLFSIQPPFQQHGGPLIRPPGPESPEQPGSVIKLPRHPSIMRQW